MNIPVTRASLACHTVGAATATYDPHAHPPAGFDDHPSGAPSVASVVQRRSTAADAGTRPGQPLHDPVRRGHRWRASSGAVLRARPTLRCAVRIMVYSSANFVVLPPSAFCSIRIRPCDCRGFASHAVFIGILIAWSVHRLVGLPGDQRVN
jgi:hypothetical protein